MYFSQATKHPTVAFSVPIKSTDRMSVLGVLARRKLVTVGLVSADLEIPSSTAVAVLTRLLEKSRVFRREISTGQRGRPSPTGAGG